MVSHLLNIDKNLAMTVAGNLAIHSMPKPAQAAVKTRMDLPASDKLSILKNGPDSFKGRKVGVLAGEGFDGALFSQLEKALEAEGAIHALVAPHAGQLKDSSGQAHTIDEKVDGGPSVLFDAIVILPGKGSQDALLKNPAALAFISDAFNHHKFIGYGEEAKPLLDKAGIGDVLDKGCLKLKDAKSVSGFIKQCRQLRYWQRGL